MPTSKTSLDELLYETKRIAEHRMVLTEEKIKKIYQSLVKKLNSYLAEEYVKYADGDGRLFTSRLRQKAHYARFLEEIAEQIDSISPEIKDEIMTLVDDTYTATYKGMAEAVKKASDMREIATVLDDSLVRPEVLKQAVNNNISKLTLPRVMEKNRQEIIYQMQQTLNTGLIVGDRYETMAKKIMERADISYGKAINIVRTESHRNIEAGMMDCAKNISEGLEGNALIYTATWLTMDDERVRPNQMYKTKKGWVKTKRKNGADHEKMDGVAIQVGDKFNLGEGIYTECPGMSGYAKHDCRCRCTLSYKLMTREEFEASSKKQINVMK